MQFTTDLKKKIVDIIYYYLSLLFGLIHGLV